MWEAIYPYVGTIVPPIGLGILFYIAMRGLLNADKLEREAEQESEK